MKLDKGVNFKGKIEIPRYSVIHHYELAGGGLNSEFSVEVEFGILHEFVEVVVVEVALLVEGQFQSWFARQVTLHSDGPVDGRINDDVRAVEEHLHFFYDIYKYLISRLVIGNRVRGGVNFHGRGSQEQVLFRDFHVLADFWRGNNKVLDLLRRSELRVAEVHHFVNDLVNQNEVFADGLFADDPAKILDDFGNLVHVLQNQRGGDVESGGAHDVDGVPVQENVVDSVQVEDRRAVFL